MKIENVQRFLQMCEKRDLLQVTGSDKDMEKRQAARETTDGSRGPTSGNLPSNAADPLHHSSNILHSILP